MIKKLRNRLARRRKKTAPRVEVIDLATWNGDGDQMLTPIKRPDSLQAVPHSIPALDPDQADMRLLVTQLVAELHQRGAVDAGHAYVLDHWLDALVAGWKARVEQQALGRRWTVQRLIAVDKENLRREAQELLRLQRELRQAEEGYRYWRDVLAGRTDAQPPRTPARKDAVEALPFPQLADYQPKGLPAAPSDEPETGPTAPVSPLGPRPVEPVIDEEEDSDVA